MNNKIAAICLTAALLVLMLTACGETAVNEGTRTQAPFTQDSAATGESVKQSSAKPKNETTRLRFEDIDYTAKNYEQYAGTQIKIRGYMSSLSPVDGRFIYLMNVPYQSCPFCQPNTSNIVNTVAAYAPNGKRLDFYDGPIEITGTVEIDETIDEFGYYYPFKLINTTYTKLDTAELSENAKMYGALSQDGIIDDIVLMMNQVYVNAYFKYYDDLSIDDVAEITDDDVDRVINRIQAISKTEYADLIAIMEDLKAYNSAMNANLQAEAYEENITLEMEQQYYAIADKMNAWLNKFEI